MRDRLTFQRFIHELHFRSFVIQQTSEYKVQDKPKRDPINRSKLNYRHNSANLVGEGGGA